MLDDPLRVYQELSTHVTSKLAPVKLQDAVWLKDPSLLRDELLDSANANCGLTLDQLQLMDLNDWRPALSQSEQEHYQKYLDGLEMPENLSERPLRGVCVSQNPDFIFMAGSNTSFPVFTKSSTRRVMLTSQNRWLSAIEKMALYGWPVHPDPW